MLKNKKIGFGITGSFCSMDDMLQVLQYLVNQQSDVYVFVTPGIFKTDTRFNTGDQLQSKVEAICKHPIITTIEQAEPFGPKIPLDLFVVYPCSANTVSKLVHGINDNAVTMGVKCTLRTNKNIVLGIYTNDGLSTSGANIMHLLNTKNFYLVPMLQDDIIKKPNSLVADVTKFQQTMEKALCNQQIHPVFLQVNDD